MECVAQMKIFLSSLEVRSERKDPGVTDLVHQMIKDGIKMKWNLMSYYYIQNKIPLAEFIRDNSELIIIDSGAHSFQFGKKVNWVEYTKQYAEFIKRFDRPNVVGYFEMDIENIIGYDKVKELRKILESVSNKIIPVWHPNRGIDDFTEMCKKYSGKVVAIGGFRNTDIKDSQYLMFLKVARKYNCKVHCLGMTRTNVLDKVPFDFTDSSSWSANSRFGNIGHGKFKKGHVSKEFSKTNTAQVFIENYKIGIAMQEHYHNKWRKECKD